MRTTLLRLCLPLQSKSGAQESPPEKTSGGFRELHRFLQRILAAVPTVPKLRFWIMNSEA